MLARVGYSCLCIHLPVSESAINFFTTLGSWTMFADKSLCRMPLVKNNSAWVINHRYQQHFRHPQKGQRRVGYRCSKGREDESRITPIGFRKGPKSKANVWVNVLVVRMGGDGAESSDTVTRRYIAIWDTLCVERQAYLIATRDWIWEFPVGG